MSKKVAIPSDGEIVNAHFGRSEAFTVFKIEGNEAYKVEVLSATGLQHQHEGLASMFKRNGIEALICGGIGGGMITSLKATGLDVITGASGSVTDVAQSYAKGTLISTRSVCQAHEHHEHHGHGHHN